MNASASPAGRPGISSSLIQRDLDRLLKYYNLSYRLRGHTPTQALCETLGLEELPPLVAPGDHEEDTEGLEPIAA